jgi:hypothetical protein
MRGNKTTKQRDIDVSAKWGGGNETMKHRCFSKLGGNKTTKHRCFSKLGGGIRNNETSMFQ